MRIFLGEKQFDFIIPTQQKKINRWILIKTTYMHFIYNDVEAQHISHFVTGHTLLATTAFHLRKDGILFFLRNFHDFKFRKKNFYMIAPP